MKINLKNKIIYQVYVRNFTEDGTFKALENHLDYIKSLGTDILYLLPINPIGEVNRKGDLGSPYSIFDYESINPELGDLDSFIKLINDTHARDMKIIIDIVFNHTSYDSKLFREHRGWFYKNKKNVIASKCDDWTDVIDLNYENNDELVDYLLSVLEKYIKLGVDGFRFDVVSLLGENFFIKLKNEFLKKYPDTILLGESIDASFLTYVRREFQLGISDNDLYNYGFDMLYPYNCFSELRTYLETNDINYLTKYKILLSYESANAPINALRLRCIENHDQKRICEFCNNNLIRMKSLAAYSIFMKGPALIYNGLETKADHHLSLFTKDLLDLNIDEDWFNFIKKIISLKKDTDNLYLIDSIVDTSINEQLVIKNLYQNKNYVLGIFNLSENKSIVQSEFLEDGLYKDLISDKIIEIKDHKVEVSEPLELVRYEK